MLIENKISLNHHYVVIVILLVFHYFITNVLEKIFVDQYITTSKRPDSINENHTCSLGMPSGHVETTTILCAFLVHNNIISIKTSLVIIFIMTLQRIMSKRHTVSQTIFGFLTGLIYSYIYTQTDFSWISLLILLIVNLILLVLRT